MNLTEVELGEDAIVVGASIFYIWKEKKKGRKCIGCPFSGSESCHLSPSKQLTFHKIKVK